MKTIHAMTALVLLTLAAPVAQAATHSVKDGVDAWSNGDYAAAVRTWEPLAQKGDADALFNLAQAYKLGRGVPLDLSSAERLYGQAAEKGHVQAADAYGLLLFQEGERERALPYLQASAARGDPRAMYILGVAHFNGDLVAKDWVRAYALASLARQAGLPQAAEALARMDEHVPLADRQKSVVVAEQISAQAQANRERLNTAVELDTRLAQAEPVARPPSPPRSPKPAPQITAAAKPKEPPAPPVAKKGERSLAGPARRLRRGRQRRNPLEPPQGQAGTGRPSARPRPRGQTDQTSGHGLRVPRRGFGGVRPALCGWLYLPSEPRLIQAEQNLEGAASCARLPTLDLIRGVAVLGILAINIAGFAGPMVGTLRPSVAPFEGTSPELLDKVAWSFGFLLFEGKMRALFTLLFGAGLVLFSQRADAAGRDGDSLQLRRLGWLLIFGMAHYLLLWWGDILFLYAACGIVALTMRSIGDRPFSGWLLRSTAATMPGASSAPSRRCKRKRQHAPHPPVPRRLACSPAMSNRSGPGQRWNCGRRSSGSLNWSGRS
ncbi:hypothetical protein [Novosphingobium panipatense]